MIEREYEDLIQEVLDGDATPAQIERLEMWLASSAEGRARRKELEGMFQALRKVPSIEPPTELKDDVLRALRTRPARGPATRSAWSWSPASRLRPAFVFAAGLAAGAIGYGAMTQLPSWPPGDFSVTGTMMPSKASQPGADAVRRAWSAGPSQVEAISWRTADSRVAAFQVRKGEARIEIEYDPAQLVLVGIDQMGAGASLIHAGPGKLVVSGENRGEFTVGGEFTVEWRQLGSDSPSPRVTVLSGAASAQSDLPAGGTPAAR